MNQPEATMLEGISEGATSLRAWGICALMLVATMLNYMDRQTLAQQAQQIRDELELSNRDYGWLESGFGISFAIGGIVTGLIADRVSLRLLYPAILVCWSAVGFATGRVTNYTQLFLCRIALGFFEAGQWPCALAAAQRLLPARQRTLGNSILQSGASLGAILTPQIILLLNTGRPGGWRLPFLVVGAVGLVWALAWLVAIRPCDLEIKEKPASTYSDEIDGETASGVSQDATAKPAAGSVVFSRRFLALVVVVIAINFCWQNFRAWMPMMLEKQYGYSNDHVQYFSSLYYLVAGIGCLAVGFLVRWLAALGWSVHRARMATFGFCVLLTGLGALPAFLPASWLLLGVFLAIGFGSLGQFPTYYAFTQELSVREMGKVTGILSFVCWISWAVISDRTGWWIDRTRSYTAITVLAGLAPVLGLLALLFLWNSRGARTEPC
ncbi:MAG: MFS transporter [Isosphaeraceae bacterium]